MHAGQRSGTIIALKSFLEHAASLLLSVDTKVVVVIHVFVRDVDRLVWALLVDLHDVLLSLFHEHATNVPHISQFGTLLDLVCDLWVLGEDFFLQEFLRE